MIALVLALSMVACSNKSDKPVSDTSNAETEADARINASGDELLLYYIEDAVLFYEGALEIETMFPYCADSFYSLAAANICSMRYAIDCLLEMKGVSATDDERLRDWDEIAALGWSSPFPYFFEGIVLEARGDTAGASECYRKAKLNPGYYEADEGLKDIKNLDEKALGNLKAELEDLEDMIFEATFGPMMIAIERNENNFDISYLRGKAAECMTSEDTAKAYYYYLAVLYTDPLDGDSYADLAKWGLQFYGPAMAEVYVDAGLQVDYSNTRLASLANEIKEAAKK